MYQVVCCHKDGDSREYGRTYYEALNRTLLTQKYRGSPPNIFYVLEALCMTVQLSVAKNHIN